jgi:hypothetical protein
MRTTHPPTLRSLIERLRVDALRLAAEKKSGERRPRPGGNGAGRQRPDSGGVHELGLFTGDRRRGLFEEMHRLR